MNRGNRPASVEHPHPDDGACAICWRLWQFGVIDRPGAARVYWVGMQSEWRRFCQYQRIDHGQVDVLDIDQTTCGQVFDRMMIGVFGGDGQFQQHAAHTLVLQQREAGIGILLISEDLDEIRALSDRIAVIYEGRIMGVIARGQGTVEQIGLMMAGVSMDEARKSTA